MMRMLLLLAAVLALPASAQQAQQAQRPLPEEAAFARLEPELRSLLGHLSPGEALRQVEFARQNLIALGQPSPTREQMRRTVQTVLSPDGYSVLGASANETSFPPLSPLVTPPPPVLGR